MIGFVLVCSFRGALAGVWTDDRVGLLVPVAPWRECGQMIVLVCSFLWRLGGSVDR
jgi:hypothetical protein